MFHTVFLKYICLINYDEFCNVQITGCQKPGIMEIKIWSLRNLNKIRQKPQKKND